MTAVAFLNGHIDLLAGDFDITVVCNFDGSENAISSHAKTVNIQISRNISPLSDLSAIWNLTRFFRTNEFVIAHSVSPKAGLITAISGWLARTPIRIHWFTGQVWVLMQGPKRSLLKNLDRLIGLLATAVLVDSPSQREFLLEQRVIKASKSAVLGAGSISGVDTIRFRPNLESRNAIRKELGIVDPQTAVILFVGRLSKDKGIDTLLEVFASGELANDPFLILVGPDEDSYTSRLSKILGTQTDRSRYIEFTPEPERYMAAADIFCMPSLREGFGLSIIEAGSVGLPTIASRIYGITDAIEDQSTGILITPGCHLELLAALNRLLIDSTERTTMGARARKRVADLWEARNLEARLKSYYEMEMQSASDTGDVS